MKSAVGSDRDQPESRRVGAEEGDSGTKREAADTHLATGWDAGQLKVGSFTRSERMAKWNEALRIEEALGEEAQYAGWSAFPAGVRDAS